MLILTVLLMNFYNVKFQYFLPKYKINCMWYSAAEQFLSCERVKSSQFIHSKMLNLEMCLCHEPSLLPCAANNIYFNKNIGGLDFNISLYWRR